MNIQIEQIHQATYLNILSAIMKKLNIPQTINRLVPYDSQCLTTPGEIVQLIVLDILSGRQALVHLEEWASELDLEKLISPDVEARFFNDDAISRHLDRLHDADIHQVFSELSLQAYRKEEVPIEVLHGDTTSKSVYGSYASLDDSSDDLLITEGYSRDRQGYKQFQYGMVSNKDGLPFYADVHDGNTSDKKWNPDILKELKKQFDKVNLSEFIYVADSAAMTKDTLDMASSAGAYLITRGPNHLKIIKNALKQADQTDNQWSEPFSTATSKKGAIYRVQEQSAAYQGHDLRLIVVESSMLDKKKTHTLEKKRRKEKEQLEDRKKAFERLSFHCEADAQEARLKWQREATLEFHTVQTNVEAHQTLKRKRGRPKKGETPEEVTTYHVVMTSIDFDQKTFEKARRKASRFVLVSTVPSDYQGKNIDSQELLRLYKGQTSVEMNFAFIKDPFFVDEVYLKKPHRIEVLGYLFLIALLVYRVFQRQIRQHVTEECPIRGAAKRKLTRPTGQAIFQLFKYVQVVVFRLPNGERQRQFGKPLTYEQRKVLEFLDLDESIYL